MGKRKRSRSSSMSPDLDRKRKKSHSSKERSKRKKSHKEKKKSKVPKRVTRSPSNSVSSSSSSGSDSSDMNTARSRKKRRKEKKKSSKHEKEKKISSSIPEHRHEPDSLPVQYRLDRFAEPSLTSSINGIEKNVPGIGAANPSKTKLDKSFEETRKGHIHTVPSSHGDPVQKASQEDSDSEDELMFDWENHRQELNQMFFQEQDMIKRGTEEYHDFWKFIKKYHGLQKQKKIRQMCANGSEKKQSVEKVEAGCKESAVYGLPQAFDKRYHINFALKQCSIEELRSRLPPRDLDDGTKRLSSRKLNEFKFILLLYFDFMQKQKFEKLKKLRSTQANLPIAEYREKIVQTVRENSVVIIAGDTGCGKSTQVPQYLLASGYSNIACTQPRRIACISLAKRVSYETLNCFGSLVGYQIRFEKNKTDHTKIVFLTEGLLLRQVSTDSHLSMYDVIILDEIHERHLDTDFLLGVVKCLVVRRPDAKVVLMSATINLELFRRYFLGKAPVIQVPGRLYPINLQYFPIPTIEAASKKEKINPAPYVRILQLIDNKYPADERGDVLVFLSGVSEIGTVVEAARLYAQQTQRWVVLPLHSTLSVAEQEKVFDVPPEGVRKCIVATNIAETSVTIDGVRFVVDSGKVKEMSYDATSKMRKLKEFWISQASAEQRKGRAGRTGPGTCFRLYSEQDYGSFNQYSSPEIQRVPLDSLVLRMVAMGLPDTRLFPFIEPPAKESLDNALLTLKAQGALTSQEQLTTVGRLLAQLPMDVALGKMLLMGSLFHQVEPVLSLSAAMSVQSPFTNRAYRDPACVALVQGLQTDHGDPFTLLAAYREWLGVKLEGRDNSRRWCRCRGLEEQRFYEMTKLRHQFAQLLKESGLQEMASSSCVPLSSAERAKRHGQLQQLRGLRRELHRQGQRKTRVLRLAEGEAVGSDDDDSRTDIKEVDFRIKNDGRELETIHRSTAVHSHLDTILLKLILCSGLYPNVAIADEHNNYKPGSEQLFHTPSKPFTILHPNSVFASQPECLQVADSDIVDLPGFTVRHPASIRHQLLVYVSLLETHKPFVVDVLRVPAAQVLLLFAHSLDTNADFTVIACDSFIELKFPEDSVAQNLLFQAVQLRLKWKKLLELRIQASTPTVVDHDRVVTEGNQLEKELAAGLVDFFLSEPLYSLRRLLPADVAVLHMGPGPGDCVLSANPFSSTGTEPCYSNTVKGGVDLTDFLTYNCLLDTQCSRTTITSYDTLCPYCDEELHLTALDRLAHMADCLKRTVQHFASQLEREDEEQGGPEDPSRKVFKCEVCGKVLRLTIKEIFKHKKSHRA